MVGSVKTKIASWGDAGKEGSLVAGIVSISKGKDPEYYTQASKGPEYYSAGAGIDGLEPEGTWTGDGCRELGLRVGMPIDKGVFLRLFSEHTDPRDGRRLGRAMPGPSRSPRSANGSPTPRRRSWPRPGSGMIR